MGRNNRSGSIRKKLRKSYGAMVALFLLGFTIFNFILIGSLKTSGIDRIVENSIDSIFSGIDELLKSSVRQHLELKNEKLITLGLHYAELAEQGILPLEEAQQRVKDFISNDKIGESGYSYAVDNRGFMLAHPVEEYRGKDFSWDEGIQRHLEQKQDYVEYQRQNPGDTRKRDKMLYRNHLEPWDWVIASTAYSDDQYIRDIRINDIELFITNERINNINSISIIDGNGSFILPPKPGQEDTDSCIEAITPHLEQMKENGKGRLFLTPDESPSISARAIVFYSYLPTLDWLIAGVGYPSELYGVIYGAYLITAVYLILAFLIFIILNRRISIKFTDPIHRLVSALDTTAGGDLDMRLNIHTGDEFGILSDHFNNFMSLQQDYVQALEEAEESIRLLAKFPEENPNPVIRLDSSGKIEYANTAALDNIITPLNLELYSEMPADILGRFTRQNSLTGRNEFTIGTQIYSFSVSGVTDTDGVYIYGRNITRQKKYESLQLLSDNIFRKSIEGIVITDGAGNIESVNPAFTEITGYSAGEAIGKNPRILKSHKHGVDFYRTMWEELKSEGSWSGEIWNRRKNGEVYPEYITISSVRDDSGRTERYISFFHDLSEIKEKEERIRYEATHDQLTGLPNTDYLVEKINSLISAGEQQLFSLIFIDIKNFKRINESIGPESGDRLLKQIAARLSDITQGRNIAARAGSDEFVLLLGGKVDELDVSSSVSDIGRILSPPFIIRDREIDLKISTGISRYPADGTEPRELLTKAEAALNISRQNVNRDVVFYSPTFREQGLSRLEIEAGLKNAFENDGFYLNYQPKVSAADGRIIGSEALVRLKPVDGQYIGPDVFIPVAEEIGLIEALGIWVLEKACRDTVRLIGEGYPDIHVAVNLSPWQFREAELHNQVRNIITATGIPPANLNLEITESMAIDNVVESIGIMKKLTDIGLSLSIDDFGTGYSSLSYLAQFPVDVLKIDKAFVTEIPHDPKKTGVVKAILSLAENLGMKTVAEGVETVDHYNFLRERGCSQIQGYYFHKPMLIEDLSAVLKKERNGG